ncbi:IS66 family insertion sequence element accessory protein TnpB [Treponema primitia]|uniref:IS66 family insertion sequence element accessory protein TnpB n=1 Tax=Treponema primitia TaxID=88058 RepID=UPI00059FB8F0|nr:IS66 family insertion sequence element accessory protein TnpB [Treponema primitia]
MKTKEKVINNQHELQKSVSAVADVLKDVPAQPKEKTISSPKPVTPKAKKETIKQPAPDPAQVEKKPSLLRVQAEPDLIIRPKPVNVHCGVPALSRMVIEDFDKNPKGGDLFAFIDRWHKTIQVLQQTDSGSCLIKKRQDNAMEWPSLPGDANAPVVLKGIAKDKFLQQIGLPKGLSQ